MSVHRSSDDQKIAYALLRAIIGINLMMHGVSRLMAGPSGFASHLTEQFARSPLPPALITGFGNVLPFVEGGLGLLLLLGLKTRWALIGASALIGVLTFGSSLIQDWSAAAAQLLYALVLAALLALRRYNSWSVDGES